MVRFLYCSHTFLSTLFTSLLDMTPVFGRLFAASNLIWTSTMTTMLTSKCIYSPNSTFPKL